MLTVQRTTVAALLLSTAMAAGALAAGPSSNGCPPGQQATAGQGGAANLATQGAQNAEVPGTQKSEGEGTDYYAIHGLQKSEGQDQSAGSAPKPWPSTQATAPCQ